MPSALTPTLAHELRTPLHAVLASAALLDATALTADQRAHVATIREAARALVALADDTIADATGDVSAPNADAACDPRAVVDAVRRLLSPLAHAKGLALHVEVDADAPRAVRVGAGALRQVLVNLVGNAIKFTAAGHVRVRARRTGDGGVAIEVSDTGPGLDEAARSALFRPFARHDPATPGAGLGLAISAAIVRRAGGDIGVRGAAHEGCTFWVAVPAIDACAAPLAAEPDAALPASGALAGRRVLVVDDDALGRRVTVALLAWLGADAHAVATAAAAAETLRGGRFDAALLDCHLPDGDGPTLAAAIRRAERLAGRAPAGLAPARLAPIRLVALTASADDATRRRCLDAGMDDCLAKPVDAGALWAALREAPPLVDDARLDALARLEDDAPGLLARVAADYARVADGQLARLRDAVAAGDRATAASAAHLLRGASANAGAARAAWLAASPLATGAHVDALAAAVAGGARLLARRADACGEGACRDVSTVAR